jgi:hypothetical protein
MRDPALARGVDVDALAERGSAFGARVAPPCVFVSSLRGAARSGRAAPSRATRQRLGEHRDADARRARADRGSLLALFDQHRETLRIRGRCPIPSSRGPSRSIVCFSASIDSSAIRW